uniref:Uncharacterized protein n=1 Tax=Spongospora subterranea TaxID=70186 RepID=A0A0H5QSH8_9EUKA|eukprot:CRZ04612.1 hypothetical protein [Spongospora subterranea]
MFSSGRGWVMIIAISTILLTFVVLVIGVSETQTVAPRTYGVTYTQIALVKLSSNLNPQSPQPILCAMMTGCLLIIQSAIIIAIVYLAFYYVAEQRHHISDNIMFKSLCEG